MHKKPITVAMVVYSHYSRDARVRRYAESLARYGFQVDIICLKENYTPKEKNITLVNYPFPRRRFGQSWYIFEYLLFLVFSLFVLSILFMKKRYSIVHIHNMPDFLVFTAIIPRLFNSKIILDMHDPMPELYLSKFNKKNWLYRSLLSLEKKSMTFANLVITANPNFKQIFINRNSIHDNKIFVILNCPDPHIFKKVKPKIQKSTFNLFYMGTVDRRFGLDIAVNGINNLIDDIPNLRFIIIPKLQDEGRYFQEIKKMISYYKLFRYIRIEKPQPLNGIANRLSEADVGIVLANDNIFSSNIFPVKLMEFFQAGIPVIATKTKILAKFLTDKQVCFLNSNNSSEFAQAVSSLYNNVMLRKKYVLAANNFLKKNNWPKEEKKYLCLVKKLIN